ncbi:alpha-tocopherol transfer protein-like [Trichonephila clavata]|uniref:Alpha-tocopherol transfer protein-like n=1 Tax=Trichonephila clavata TaxID=2740835 RepID=A0A8X6GAZ4_TRICU|nr:alpha-tocopherol transfer protein-like [Trichonephila clavata]
MAAKYEEMMKAKGFLPYDLDTLPAKFIQKAKEELGETDEIRRTALEQFKKRILEHKKLKASTEDEFLIQFLRARKYDVDKSVELLSNYLNLGISYPDFFNNMDKEKMYKLARSGFVNVLPFRDNDGCLLLTMKMGNWDPEEFDVKVLFCTLTSILFCQRIYPMNQICGVRLIFDSKDYSFKQLRCFFPRYFRLVATALRNCLPVRFAGIHVVNEAVVFRKAWSFFKLLLSEKIKSRIFLHGDNMKDLHKYIPKELLPQEYGGDYTNYGNGNWITKEIDKIYDKFVAMVKICLS